MDPSANFTHLHLHTQWSLLDGAIRLKPLFNLLNEWGSTACAITDHGNMFGAADFYFAAKNAGIKPIIGCEVYITPKARFEKKGKEDNAYHLVLLAMDNTGYANLAKLVSFANLEGFYYVPRIDHELLKKYNEGLICLTACLKGQIPQLILKDDKEKLCDVIEQYLSVFDDRLYLEIQENRIPEQDTVNKGLLALSKQYAVPLVATNDCHYLKKTDALAHEVLLCIQTRKIMSDANRMRLTTDEFFVKSPAEMQSSFDYCPEAIENTAKIAGMCNVTLDTGTYHFPKFDPPPGSTLDAHLEQLCWKGFEERMRQNVPAGYNGTVDAGLYEQYRQRLIYEIDVIKKTGFAGYFLIVADFISWAKQNGIPVGPGRGSAAASLAAYSLGITELDPLRYNLLFERFLNPERVSMPDIDVDFCFEKRDRVVQYVTEKYGSENVGQITTFGSMKTRAVIRDVGRALGLPYQQVDRMAKLIQPEAEDIQDAIKREPRLKERCDQDPNIAELARHAAILEGLTRHASVHAAGIVIGNRPLVEYLPIYKGDKGEIITQFDMKAVEKIGLIKFDFLGLKTLTVIDHTLAALRKKGIEVDINNLAMDDFDTFKLLQMGKTLGIFQFESRGMRELLVKTHPERFEDLIALAALYRPGPLNSGIVSEFVHRKNDPSLIAYELPQLEPVLEETYGVMVYQEQVMKAAIVLANFSMKDADGLRKGVAKKIPEELKKYREQFIDGAVGNNVPKHTAKKIYDAIEEFGQYGFNKAHSAAYALIAYQTAYLKAHYFPEFMAALLTSEAGDADKVLTYIGDCRENNCMILPPDINESQAEFIAKDDGSILFGLSAIKNLGDAAIEGIVKSRAGARKNYKGFESLQRFMYLCDSKVTKKVIENLIKAGCFDYTGLNRAQLLHTLEAGNKNEKKKKALSNEGSLFSMEDVGRPISVDDIPELSEQELLAGENEAFGFHFTRHPLDTYADVIPRIVTHDTETLRSSESSFISLAATIMDMREFTTKRGKKMAYLVLQDKKGVAEAVVFPDLYAECERTLKSGRPIVVAAELELQEDGAIKLKAQEVHLLDTLARSLGPRKTVAVTVDCNFIGKQALDTLVSGLREIPGESPVKIDFILDGQVRPYNPPALAVDPDKMENISSLFSQGLTYKVVETRPLLQQI